MARQLSMFSCEIYDSKKSYIDIIKTARDAGIIHQFKSNKTKHSIKFEYVLVGDLNKLFDKQIMKPEIEGWTYGRRKMNGNTERMYYRDLWIE
jgi:hypothetical protein